MRRFFCAVAVLLSWVVCGGDAPAAGAGWVLPAVWLGWTVTALYLRGQLLEARRRWRRLVDGGAPQRRR